MFWEQNWWLNLIYSMFRNNRHRAYSLQMGDILKAYTTRCHCYTCRIIRVSILRCDFHHRWTIQIKLLLWNMFIRVIRYQTWELEKRLEAGLRRYKISLFFGYLFAIFVHKLPQTSFPSTSASVTDCGYTGMDLTLAFRWCWINFCFASQWQNATYHLLKVKAWTSFISQNRRLFLFFLLFEDLRSSLLLFERWSKPLACEQPQSTLLIGAFGWVKVVVWDFACVIPLP